VFVQAELLLERALELQANCSDCLVNLATIKQEEVRH
jgi:hypothetical protein